MERFHESRMPLFSQSGALHSLVRSSSHLFFPSRLSYLPPCSRESFLSISQPSAGYPIITAFTGSTSLTRAGFNLGGVNASGQVPETVGNFGLIDADTPTSAYSIKSDTGATWELVFSDECQWNPPRNLQLHSRRTTRLTLPHLRSSFSRFRSRGGRTFLLRWRRSLLGGRLASRLVDWRSRILRSSNGHNKEWIARPHPRGHQEPRLGLHGR